MTRISWETKTFRVKDLVPFSENPRHISKDKMAQLKNSLEKFDYAELVAVQPDLTIIAGHMRVKAMKLLGWQNKEIPVRVPNRQLNQHEMREYLIRSNKNTGDWDWDILANSFDVEELMDWGFSEEELIDSLKDIKPESPEDEKQRCGECGQVIKKKK